MIIIRHIKNRFVIFVSTVIIIFFIGFLDYISGKELSFSVFYLFPIALLALYRNSKSVSIIVSSFFASFIWFLADYFTREYSYLFYPLWNSFVRFTMFTSVGLLLLFLKEKHIRLNAVNEELKALNEEKNKFIGIAAHDLRSPIGVIFSYADILVSTYKNQFQPEIFEILNTIKSISNNTLIVLQNLLDIAKIESGKIELTFKNQDYISFVKQQILLNQILANYKNITILFESQSDNILIDFDEHYLSEAVDNLLSNAVKYSYKNSKIIVRLSILNHEQVLTEVIDNGKGISEPEQQNLFQYFQTTSTRPTDGEQSTGLGLAIVKKIINMHNGEIGVKSTPNQGSNFFYQLPVNQIKNKTEKASSGNNL